MTATAPSALVPPLAAATHIRAALLLTDGQGRVLISTGTDPRGDADSLPGGPLASGESPAAGAARAAQAATGLAGLSATSLLAVDWLPSGSAAGQPCTVHVYDHSPLTASQASALTADAGHRGGLRLVAPGELEKEVPGQAHRILAALHARAEGRTSDLEDGRVRTPGVLDLHRVLAGAVPRQPEPWTPARKPFDGEVSEARGWLIAPDGRALVHYDPTAGRARLPGGLLLPDDRDDHEATLTRSCAATVLAHIGHPKLLGYRGNQARFVATLRGLGPLPSGPCLPTVVRLFVTQEQALELTGGETDNDELEAARDAARELGFPDPGRQPSTEAPVDGNPDL
ncbi:ADP-ribose pyrophosphatase YjhB (NUDIX family) [Kitasatospora sp. MAP12-15]|uniref:NUDIX domain-containing protein n=1 Tax=unclassified Kitasatospora TaxID=2633591 RepID=UPI0024758D99|nr:NUDIX domain-containing protein [Kitasatospora sp. MAP12-44]MDH6111409.1 ADP-ribose pyrophosphatase YjhB (NUDIX family) [Kitasatospora sp. MAP12-44]